MKYFLLLSVFFYSCLNANSQCIPDTSITHNQPGTYPDVNIGLPHATVGQPYATVIQIKVLTDSTIGPLTGIVDSIVVTNVSGLPAGFSYSCNPPSCSFPGGSNACIDLTGPAPSISGTYPLVVNSVIYYKLTGLPQTLQNDITGYQIVIDPMVGIDNLDKNFFGVGQSIPNPGKDYIAIPVSLNAADDFTLTVSNLIGKKVLEQKISLQRGKTNIPVDIRELQSGIYLYSLTNGKYSVTRRMIISKD
jgi:hypothetical protein